MDKLTYKKSSDVTIDIDLHNGYTVRTDAIYHYESKRYYAKFYLKENTIDKYCAMEALNNRDISFPGDRSTIKTDILKFVSKLLSENFFENPIMQCEYEIMCFDKGNDFFETGGEE